MFEFSRLSFEWDKQKEEENIKRHGINFLDATLVFSDPNKIFLRDTKHSQIEDRWFCFGKIKNGIATVRFVKEEKRSELSELVSGGKEKIFMKKKKLKKKSKVIYEEDFDGVRIEDLEIVKDPGLPPPSEIAKMLKKQRITIMVDNEVIVFFKDQAKKNKSSYQQMIREVLRQYKNSRRAA